MPVFTSTFRITTALLLTSFLACGEPAQQETSVAPSTPLVEAVEARFGAIPLEEKTPGQVRARNQVTIRPEVAGRVVEVLAGIGEAVERGQVLIRLDEVEARERLRQAEADVRLAKATAVAARARVSELEARASRMRSLANQELVSAQELESLEAQLDALRASADEAAARVQQRLAAVDERRSALAKTVVRAPVAGRLGERRAEVGMLVDSSTVLFVIGNLDELIVKVNLTETVLANVEEGLPVVIETRAAGETVRAALSRISPFLAEDSFTTVGEIDVDNRDGRLRPGMFVTVRILVGQSQRATLVPVSAVWEDPATSEPGVFVIEEAASLEPPSGITTNANDDPHPVEFRRVEVLAQGRGVAGVIGVEEGEWVVTVGQHLLSTESRVGPDPDRATSDLDLEPELVIATRVRPVSWERVLGLQDLQDEDLLEGFLDKQRKVSAALGAEIPESEDDVNRVLEDKESPPVEPGG